MPEIPRSERKTKNLVNALFKDKARLDCLGYDYLGEWHKVPAAVVAGTNMESTLRELCSSHGVVILDINKQLRAAQN